MVYGCLKFFFFIILILLNVVFSVLPSQVVYWSRYLKPKQPKQKICRDKISQKTYLAAFECYLKTLNLTVDSTPAL